ncbi:MAG TPA: Gfo/Idh/MocA family oxidoreductase [Leptospiraceae bacterium]|nr:Gfo/Idh/MocA family oxidoreductase [Leptospiraceae bacterium]
MKIGIVGCGLIGRKRAASVDADDRIVAAYDTNATVLEKFCADFKCEASPSAAQLAARADVDAVIVSAVHSALAEISREVISAGKHLLVEKPAARNAQELRPVVALLESLPQEKRARAKCGFNHRFHPAMLKAKELLESNDCGELMFVRGRYGHGGRPGYDREWRADPEISGGGELLDQGMHLIDLSRWFLGDLPRVQGIARTFFWDMKVDDNAFMLLETEKGQVAQLHVSWTEWKNLFSFEIYAKRAKLHIEGLGGSYGLERIAFYPMKPEMGPPDSLIYEFPGADLSWKREWKNFKASIEKGEPLLGSLHDALAALEIVDTIYRRKS